MVKLFRVRPAIILLGDSLTQYAHVGGGNSDTGNHGVGIGWASLLSDAYQRRADVFNRGYSGYNTRHILNLIPKLFGTGEKEGQRDVVCNDDYDDDDRILFCTLWLGANDAAVPDEPQHVPVSEYGENLNAIITSIRDRCCTTLTTRSRNNNDPDSGEFPIILMTPPPVDDEVWRKYLMKWYGLEHYTRKHETTRLYVEEVKRIAMQHSNCYLLDVWDILGGNKATEEYTRHLCDGLHLGPSGNQLVFDGLMKLLREELPHLAPLDGSVNEGSSEQQPIGIPEEEKQWDELC